MRFRRTARQPRQAPPGGEYQRWADYLERWSEGAPEDPDGLPALDPARYPADTLARLAGRISEALGARLQGWSDALVSALNATGDEFAFGRALTQARTGLHRIRALAAHPGLPEDLRTRLTATVDEQVRRVQEDLERGLDRRSAAGRDPGWVEQRRRTLRDNPLTAVLAQRPPADPAGWAYDHAAAPGRRVVPGTPPRPPKD
ncbi:hypothetical protein [Kitasatospora sp. NPDC088351]|uniref:hypothetical protein n=1 Tax=unclassified Kitasatospora TaxID=2633591 RepID=UPI00342D3AE4